jgi:hypothetical protein
MPTCPTRRLFLAVGSAGAVFASLSTAVAVAASASDPVFAALAERDRAHAAWEALDEANEARDVAREALSAVTFKGEKVYDLAHLDCLAGRWTSHTTAAELEETIGNLRRGWAMQQAEMARPDPDYAAARAALEARQEEGGEDEDEAPAHAAFEEFCGAERAIFEASPTSRAGAIALLRFTARFLEELGINDTSVEDVLPDALRRAADFFELEA